MATQDPHPIVLWELTRLCDLHCRGCPSGAGDRRDPNELTTYEAYKTIDEIAALKPREVTITGGDPLEREDVYQVIDYARRRGLDPALMLTPSAAMTMEALEKLEANGLTTVVFAVDGSTAAIHESLHGVRGTFGATLRTMRWAECTGLRIEVNTLVTRRNAHDLDAIAALIRPFQAVRWNVHFLVPVGASRLLEVITAEEVEHVFAKLDEIRASAPFALRVVEAPHYRRFRLERLLESRLAAESDVEATAILDEAVDGARSFVYITHAGEVRPSEFAPHVAGNLRYRPLGHIYRGSDLFVALRDPDNLHGRCRRCNYRALCGGSRARAFAMTGDLFASDPLCAYEPDGATAVPLVSRGKETIT